MHAAGPVAASPRREYLVFSSAGKLVFSTAAEDNWSLAQVSVMHALLALFAGEYVGDELKHIKHGDGDGATRISFLSIAPLHLACISSHDEPQLLVRARLGLLHAAVISLVSKAKLDTLMKRAPSFDLRRVIGDTDVYLEGVVHDMHAQLPGGVRVCRVDPSLRRELATASEPEDHDGVLYVLIVKDGQLVSLCHPKKHSAHVCDLQLLMAMVAHGPERGAHDSWFPMCLPYFAPHGFVYVYISPIAAGHIVLVTTRPDGYTAAQAWRATLNGVPCFDRLAKCTDYGADELGIPGLRHFVYVARRTAQHTATGPHRILYEHGISALCGDMEPRAKAVLQATDAERAPPVAPPMHVQYYRTDDEAMLAWQTNALTLCVTVASWLAKT
ncbi:Vacuolar fusion protein mon1 [Malassezia cuniculi]|uniref:Vacuolar fusion protein MON1 n=1 Tax=Malassezia cuniculi TaxID=948313 RepID=A0AAF0ETU7_9BASI|nr:Vacuolar fusion protein mon1 [Malassezia cuniculi]